MNTTNKLQISEEMLSDIILCEPVTRKGLEALGRLGLSDVITVDYFYEHLRVESKFEIGKKYESQRETVDDSDNILYYQYTVSFEQFENALSFILIILFGNSMFIKFIQSLNV